MCGIVSWGIGCGQTFIPAVYTRVDQYVEWIIRVSGEVVTVELLMEGTKRRRSNFTPTQTFYSKISLLIYMSGRFIMFLSTFY